MSDSVITLANNPIPLLNTVLISPDTFSWALPVSGRFDEAGAWLLGGSPTDATPNADSPVVFNTGSSVPYIVSGDLSAASIQIVNDAVTFTGHLAASGTITWTSAGQINLGSATLSAGGGVTLAADYGAFQPGTSTPDAITLSAAQTGTAQTITTYGSSTLITLVATASDDLLADDSRFTSAGNSQITLAPPVETVSTVGNVVVPPQPAASSVLSADIATAVPQNQTLFGDHPGDVLFGTPAGNIVLVGGPGSETLVADAGATTLVGGGSGDLMFGGTGQTTLFGAAGGGDTMVGGAGSNMMALHAGDLAFGGPGQTQEFGSAVGPDTMVGGAGTTTMIGAGGQDVFVGDSGAATVFSGSGPSTVFAGRGDLLVVGGSGADTMLFAAGHATVFAGSGADVFDFVAGAGGGQDVIAGFKPGTDRIALFGYDADALRAQAATGATSFSLSDGTTLTLAGLSHLDPASVI